MEPLKNDLNIRFGDILTSILTTCVIALAVTVIQLRQDVAILNEKMKAAWVTQEEFRTANSSIKDLENRMEKQLERLENELRELQQGQ